MAAYSIANTVTVPADSTLATLVASAVNAAAPPGAIAVAKTQPLIAVIVGAVQAVAESATPVGTFHFEVTGNPGSAGEGTVSIVVRWTS